MTDIPRPGLRALLLLVLSVMVVAAPSSARAGQPTGLSFGLLRDADATLTIDEVSSPALQARFADYAPVLHNIGYTRDALWMRVTIHNPRPVQTDYVVDVGPPRLPDVRFFEPLAEGDWRESRSGLEVPVAERRVSSRQPLLPVRLEAGESKTLYVRVTGENSLSLGALQWRDEDFFVWENRLDQINLFQLGALSVFIVFAFVLGVFSRERLFMVFSAGLLSLGLYEACILQYGHLWWWPQAAGWSLRSPGVTMLASIVLVSLLTSMLLRRFGMISRSLKWLDAQWIVAPFLLPLMWIDYRFAIQLTATFGFSLIVVFMLVSLVAFVRDPRTGVLLLTSFLMLWAVSILRILQFHGVLSEEVISLEYSWAIAPVFSGMLMAALLARNLRALREARQRAQQEALAAATQAAHRLEEEVHERTRDLDEARRRAEEASEAKSRFLAQVSHEFRTPLHSVIGYAGLMEEEPRAPDDHRRLQAILRSGRHLLRLIDDLLQFARLEKDGEMLSPRAVNLPRLLAEITQEVALLAGKHQIVLRCEPDPALPAGVQVDDTRLRQVLINLLTNACLHSRGTQVLLSVNVVSRDEKETRLCFSVRDDGVGMPGGELPAYSAAFGHPKDSRSSGLGLGLPIVLQWVHRMGSELAVESEPGKGCCFSFCLDLPVVEPPAVVEPENREEVLADPLSADVPVHGSGGPRVLVVDDQTVNRELLAEMLRRAGCRAVMAAGGAQALRMLAEEEGIALVLIDQMMPDMDGWECLRLARESGIAVPFVLVSAAAPEPPAGWDDRLRFDGFLAKPMTPAQLGGILSRVLDDGRRPAPPSPDALERLRSLAHLGLVSGIADWIREVRLAEPSVGDFVAAVESALERMDLAAIERLAEAKKVTDS